MKVLDIILEKTPSTPTSPKPTVPFRKRPKKPPVAPPASPTPVAPPASSTPSTIPAPKRASSETKLLDWFTKRAKASKTRMERAEKVYNGRFGTKLKWLFRLVGITTAVYELYATLDELEEYYTTGKPITNSDGTSGPMTKEGYEELRELAFGTFQIQVLIPLVTPWILRFVKGVLLINWIKRIGAFASAPVTAGVSVAAMLATEAGVAAFQAWLGSSAGRDWIYESIFMEPIRLFGKFGDNAANALSKAFTGKTSYEKADEKRDKIVGPTGQGAQESDRVLPAPASDYRDSSVRYTRGKDVYVGGVPVTDADGYLDPRALDNIGVISARNQAQKRGQKDPLAGIPQRPGKPPIELYEPDKEVVPAGGDRRGSTKDTQAAWEKKNQQPTAA